MAVPAELLELLQSMRIVGVPGVVNAGETFAPQLEPSTAAIFGLAIPRTLAKVDLLLLLNHMFDRTGNAISGDIDIAGVFKAVEFPQPIDAGATLVNPNQPPSNALAYLEPAVAGPGYTLSISPDVQGLIGKLRTKVEGVLRGRLYQQVLDAAPTVAVSWRVTDSQNNNLGAGDVGNLGNAAAPVFVFLPNMVELTTSPSLRVRRLYCDLAVTTYTGPGGGPEVTNFTVGPLNVDLPDVPIPTVLAMTEDANFGGRVLVAVPQGSVLSAADEIQNRLQPALAVFNRLAALGLLTASGLSYATGINGLNDLINLLPATTFVRGSQNDLDDVVRQVRDWWPDRTWEDCIDSILLVGPRNRTVTISDRKNQWQGAGKFSLRLGPSCVAKIDRTSVFPIQATPADAIVQVIVNPEDGNFHDNISSFAFV